MALSRGTVTLLATGFVVLCGTILLRERVVAAMPQSGALFAAIGLPVNLDRLEIGPVQATLRIENDLRTLVVESEIANPRGLTMPAPLLRLSVRDAAGQTVYSWTSSPGVKIVPGGVRIPVRARLTAPPAGHDVVVEFARG